MGLLKDLDNCVSIFVLPIAKEKYTFVETMNII